MTAIVTSPQSFPSLDEGIGSTQITKFSLKQKSAVEKIQRLWLCNRGPFALKEWSRRYFDYAAHTVCESNVSKLMQSGQVMPAEMQLVYGGTVNAQRCREGFDVQALEEVKKEFKLSYLCDEEEFKFVSIDVDKKYTQDIANIAVDVKGKFNEIMDSIQNQSEFDYGPMWKDLMDVVKEMKRVEQIADLVKRFEKTLDLIKKFCDIMQMIDLERGILPGGETKYSDMAYAIETKYRNMLDEEKYGASSRLKALRLNCEENYGHSRVKSIYLHVNDSTAEVVVDVEGGKKYFCSVDPKTTLKVKREYIKQDVSPPLTIEEQMLGRKAVSSIDREDIKSLMLQQDLYEVENEERKDYIEDLNNIVSGIEGSIEDSYTKIACEIGEKYGEVAKEIVLGIMGEIEEKYVRMANAMKEKHAVAPAVDVIVDDDIVDEMEEKHVEERVKIALDMVTAMLEGYDEAVGRVQEKYTQEIEEMKEKYDEAVAEMKKKCGEAMSKVQEKYRQEVARMKARFVEGKSRYISTDERMYIKEFKRQLRENVKQPLSMIWELEGRDRESHTARGKFIQCLIEKLNTSSYVASLVTDKHFVDQSIDKRIAQIHKKRKNIVKVCDKDHAYQAMIRALDIFQDVRVDCSISATYDAVSWDYGPVAILVGHSPVKHDLEGPISRGSSVVFLPPWENEGEYFTIPLSDSNVIIMGPESILGAYREQYKNIVTFEEMSPGQRRLFRVPQEEMREESIHHLSEESAFV